MARERNRGLVLLFLLLCVVALASAFQALYIERLLRTSAGDAQAADRTLGSALVAIADFRTAQAGYLATGQAPTYWMTRADTLASTIGESISQQSAASPSASVRAGFDEANGALDDLEKIDNRARTLVKSDQRFVASDVVFMDSLQAANRLSQLLEGARDRDRQAREADMARLADIRLAAVGVSLAIGLIGAWVLLTRARTPTDATAAVADQVRVSAVQPLSLGHLQPPPPPPLAPPNPPVPGLVPDVNLTEAAGLCADLARVIDNRDVPALFERAARVLDAKGLVLWVADSSGALLRPSLTHGYSEKVRARMNGLQMDGDNATSLAFRSMQTQVVGASAPTGVGALAVPLVTATGCVGVLAAEVKNGKPAASTLSVAQMIAAQFAALVVPGEPAPQAQVN